MINFVMEVLDKCLGVRCKLKSKGQEKAYSANKVRGRMFLADRASTQVPHWSK